MRASSSREEKRDSGIVSSVCAPNDGWLEICPRATAQTRSHRKEND